MALSKTKMQAAIDRSRTHYAENLMTTGTERFAGWHENKRLAVLADFYEAASAAPESVSDAEFIQHITAAFWPTNCWAFVEQAFAIIAPGCSMRPHLARELIAHPIEAMVAGGLEDERQVIAQGTALANHAAPYVAPSLDGRQWLLTKWPQLEAVAIEVFREKYAEATN
ncbi:hypothetical protein FXN63_21710 [Pigmentiphaga aceris]|uniref:Uncharacterized protein n=1 Tax=Pigmentiphaga aceris TaxID=1940612 RepID=A0A5C0B2K7_9BURK|nr:hypothetical protein [Pigmentiphaga aceris]QEI08164.1 hypothetical protein FXN63_21710 [Pigmentiphaga aceris]